MVELSNVFLFVFAGLFPVVNPLGSAPIFLSLTSTCAPQQRNQLALGVALNSFWLLLGSMDSTEATLSVIKMALPRLDGLIDLALELFYLAS